MDRQIVAELAPTGTLRAAINMGNFLLVTGKTDSGDPSGVAPDMAAEIAKRLGVPVRYVPYERPSTLADAAGTNAWDIGLIGAEPQRAAKIAFRTRIAKSKRPIWCIRVRPLSLSPMSTGRACGFRCAAAPRIAFGSSATSSMRPSCRSKQPMRRSISSSPKSSMRWRRSSLRLLEDIKKVPGGTILPGHFMTVQQAIGTGKPNTAGAKFLQEFVTDAKKSGLVARLIEKHRVAGLSVAS